jgi:hypothetical protein
MNPRFVALLALVFATSGCSATHEPTAEPQVTAPIPVAPAIANAPQNGAPAEDPAGRPPARSAVRLIRTATIHLDVDDLATFETELSRLVVQAGGYISDSNVVAASAGRRQGTWTLRWPVDRLAEGLTAVRALGELTQFRSATQDVTVEVVDLAARTHNKQQEEKRLLELMADKSRRLEDVLVLERELSRIREEIERMQARLRSLSDRVDLSTITLTATEKAPPIIVAAPAVIVPPSFPERLSSAFLASAWRMIAVVEAGLTGLALLLPWIPLLAGTALLVFTLPRILSPVRKV